MPAERNNRIMEANFLNRNCVYGAPVESILLVATLKIFFRQHRSTAAHYADGRMSACPNCSHIMEETMRHLVPKTVLAYILAAVDRPVLTRLRRPLE
jgi:hypothetical protein